MVDSPLPVLVVGGSVAGCAVSLALAKSGIPVVLLEQSALEREMVCGEGLSLYGGLLLSGLLGTPFTEVIPYQELKSIHLMSQSATFLVNSGVEGVPRAFGVKRRDLRKALLTRAQALASVTCELSQRVVQISPLAESYVVQTQCGKIFEARELVLATGKNYSWLRTQGLSPFQFARERYGMMTHYQLSESTSINEILVWVHPKLPIEVYCTPLASGLLNLNYLVTKENSESRRLLQVGHAEEIFEQALRYWNLSAHRVANIRGAGPFGWATKSAAESRLHVIGDAALGLDPVGGMGMTHAVASALLVAEAIAGRLCCRSSVGSKALRSLVRHCRFHTSFSGFAVRSLLRHPRILRICEGLGVGRVERSIFRSYAKQVSQTADLISKGAKS